LKNSAKYILEEFKADLAYYFFGQLDYLFVILIGYTKPKP